MSWRLCARSRPDLGDAARRARREVYTDITADTPWVPVFNTRYFTLRSERVGGDPVSYVSPTYIPMHYEYLYVKDAE